MGSENKNSIKMAEDVTGIGNRHYLMGGGGESGALSSPRSFCSWIKDHFLIKQIENPRKKTKGWNLRAFYVFHNIN